MVTQRLILSAFLLTVFQLSFSAQSGITIEGIVLEAGTDRGLAGVRVSLLPPQIPPGPPKDEIAAVDGKFQIRGVAPGAYHLYAWGELDGAAYRNAEFMKAFEDRGKPISVEKTTRISVDLSAIEAP